jgi:transcriptional pleiotropic regulator of transition state genes
MKEYARNMDGLGRIVIPMEIRKINNINEGDLLGIKVLSEGILLFKINKVCAICGSTNNLIMVKGRAQCRECISEFYAAMA